MRSCTRRARSSPAPPCAWPPPGRPSKAPRTTARTRRSTSRTRTATASSSPPTARGRRGPEDLGYAGGPAPLEFEALLATVAGEEPGPHVGDGLRTGHLHLHVGDVEQGLGFYRDVIGFEEQANLGSAAFVSAGGYHHHLGFNVWKGQGVGPAPEHTAGLRHWTVELPADADVAAVRDRAEGAGAPVTDHDGGFLVRDPWGTAMAVVRRG
jgi:catechol 2,3-dioxygenase